MKSNQSGNGAPMVVLAILVILGIAAAGYAVWAHQYKPTATNQTVSQSPVTKTTTTPATTTTPSSTITGLSNDLNAIGSGLAKENADQNSVNTAVNDQQNEIQVPTT